VQESIHTDKTIILPIILWHKVASNCLMTEQSGKTHGAIYKAVSGNHLTPSGTNLFTGGTILSARGNQLIDARDHNSTWGSKLTSGGNNLTKAGDYLYIAGKSLPPIQMDIISVQKRLYESSIQ
jgi:hypothetical protein